VEDTLEMPTSLSSAYYQFKDRRTNVRIGYWRDESQKLAKELGWMFVDQHALNLPLMAHYLANDEIDTIVDEVLGKTGCD